MKSRKPTKSDAWVGRIIDGRFELLQMIARGGSGDVYRAIQRPVGRIVAIKILNPESSGSETRFRELFFLQACLSARLIHPHIVRIFDYGCDGRTFYVAMEHLEGQTVDDLVAHLGPLLPLRAVTLARQACAGLVEAHDHGLVHGDLRASNLFIAQSRGHDCVKILDLGLAKATRRTARHDAAPPSVGSQRVTPPEVLAGKPADPRTDVYALGVSLFLMLTGASPVSERATGVGRAPLTLAQANPSLANWPNLEELLDRCLAESPGARFASARALGDALVSLESAFGGASSHATPTTPPVFQTNPHAKTQDLCNVDVVDLLEGSAPVANGEAKVQPERADLSRLRRLDLSEYVAYVDLNCPFCYALHDRLHRWGGVDGLQWRLVEHASHAIDASLDPEHDTVLAKEVLALHRRAPDVGVMLPPQRCSSSLASRLLVYVHRHHPAALTKLWTAVYRALWRDGRDIGSVKTLTALLGAQGLGAELLERCAAPLPELARWQEEWTSADFDTCIPVVTHPKTGRKLVGLPSERVLAEFFLQSRSRLLDNAVCYYWPKPVVLVCGSLAVLWPLLSELRLSAEITHASVASEGESQLRKPTRPDLVVIHSEGMAPKSRETISAACSVIGIPWLLATEDPSEEAEIQALSAGAMEYLPIRGDGRVARARLRRVVASRLAYARRDEQAQKDPLTGLANRRRLISHLSAEWHRAEGFGRPLSLLLLDIDHFKAFNAEYGYLEGDRCLTRLARLFELSVHRANEFLARLESDTFIVVLPESIPEDALQLAELLRQAVTEQEIEHRTSPTQPHLTVSAGVATLIPSQTSTLDALVDAADQACQSAKAAGRNRVHVC